MVSGTTVWVWRHRIEQRGARQAAVTHKGGATRSESHSGDRSRNQVPLVLRDPIRALLEMYGTEGQSDSVAEASVEDLSAKTPDEPSIFNADVVAMGPHAFEIMADRDMVDPQEETEPANADSSHQPTSSTVNAVSEDAAHNEQIMQGMARAEDPSIGPKEVDPDTHPPTD